MLRALRLLLIVSIAIAQPANVYCAPQQMLMFRQTVRIGGRGAPIRSACIRFDGDTPSSRDSYSNFNGKGTVVRFERGKPVGQLPFDRAIQPGGWLDPPRGTDSTSSLFIAPRVAEDGVEYELRLEPTIGATNEALLADIASVWKQSENLFTEAEAVQAVTERSLTLRRYAESEIQDIIWDSEKNERARGIKSLQELSRKLQTLLINPDSAKGIALADRTLSDLDPTGSQSLRNAARDTLQVEVDGLIYADGDPAEIKAASASISSVASRIQEIKENEESLSVYRKIDELSAKIDKFPSSIKKRLESKLRLLADLALTDGEAPVAKHLGVEESAIEFIGSNAKAKEFLEGMSRAELLSESARDNSWFERSDLQFELLEVVGDFMADARTGKVSLERLSGIVAALEECNKQYSAFRQPMTVTPSVSGASVGYRNSAGNDVALGDVLRSGMPVLVDVSALNAEQTGIVAQAVKNAQSERDTATVYLKVAPGAEERFSALPDWNELRLIGDRKRLEELPENVKETVVEWLDALSSEKPTVKAETALIIDHFDREGNALKSIEEQIIRGEYKGKHLIFAICNARQFAAFQQLGRLALERGGALSVAFPTAVLQARTAPLVTELMLNGTSRPSLSPAQHAANACREVRERLERCLNEKDDAKLADVIEEEFIDTYGYASELFLSNGRVDRILIKEMIRQLKVEERSFIQLTDIQYSDRCGRLAA